MPFGGTGWGKYFSIDGRPAPPTVADVPIVEFKQVTADYFRALGATLAEGRAFTGDDDGRRQGVAVVNEAAARRFWPHATPIGQRVSLHPPESLIADEIAAAIATGQLPASFQRFPRLTIIGVVKDLQETGLDVEAGPALYVPFAQSVAPRETASGSFFLVVRTAASPLSYQASVQAVVTRLDAGLPVSGVRTLERAVADSTARRRFAMLLMGALAAVALVLVVSGLYGVTAYLVDQGRRELGVRLALGASVRRVFALVLVRGLAVSVAGVAIGLCVAAASARVVVSQLFEVSPFDPAIYAGASLLLLTVAFLACAVPALRVARLDPAATLRDE